MAPSSINRPPAGTLPGLPTTSSSSGAPKVTSETTAAPIAPPLDSLERTGGGPVKSETGVGGVKMARVSGAVETPALVLNPVHLMGQMKSSELSVNLPLKHTADLGRWISIREGTQAQLHLAVVDGEIDFKNTKFEIKDAEGKDYSLDGPLWLDPESVYIDDNGQLRAKMPCFPDPNITKQLLGPDATKVPSDPGEFLQRITQGKDVAFDVMPSNRIGTPPAPPTDLSPDSEIAPGATAVAEPNPLEQFTDLAGINFEFSGELKPGPLKLGKGALFNLREGTKVHAEGTLADMHVTMEAPFKSLSLSEGDTRIQSGNGTAKMAIDFSTNGDGDMGIDLEMHALDFENFVATTPASAGKSHRISMGKLAVENAPGHPLISMRSQEGAEDQLRVALESVAVQDLAGTMVADDTHGEQVEIRLGRSAAGAIGPMDVEASLSLDSQKKTFSLSAEAKNVRAEVGKLGLLEAGSFDLTLESGRISGSGTLAIEQSEGASRLTMLAEEGKPWAVETDIHDAHLGMESESVKVHADLSAETFGTIHLERLDLSPGAPPVLDATAEFKVALDELSIPLGPDNDISLKKGTEGTLVVSQMSWHEGDKSPAVEAELRLNIGTDALLTPGDIPGLEGARVELDVDTGDSVLILKASLSREGELLLDCGFSLRNVDLKTDLRRGDARVIPLAALPAEELGPLESVSFSEVRTFERRSELLKLPPEKSLAVPSLSRVTIHPVSTFGMLASASIDLSIPVAAMDKLRVLEYDGTEMVSRFGIDDEVGAKVKVDFTRDAGSIDGVLGVDNGTLVDGESRLTLNPPLEIDIWAQYHLPGPLAPSTELGATVHALEIRVDEDTGEAYLWPDIDLSGLLPGAAEAVGLGDTVRGQIGDKIAEALVGGSPFPADVESFLSRLSDKVTVLKEPIIVDPNASVEVTPLGGTSAETNASSSPSDSGIQHNLDALLERIDFANTDIQVRDATFSQSVLELGDGQQIHFAPGSALSVEGNPSDLTIRGIARLGATRLGTNDLGVNIGEGEANVALHVYRDSDGNAHFELRVDDLNAQSVDLRATLGNLRNDVAVSTVNGGKLLVAYHPGEAPVFELELPKVEATLNANGSVRVENNGGSVRLAGNLKGSIGIKDGKLHGSVDDLDLTAEGSGATIDGPIGSRGVQMQLSLTGAGTFDTDEKGEIHFASHATGESLHLDTQMQAADGSLLNIENGQVETLSVGLEATDISVTGLRGRINGLLPLPVPDVDKPPAVVDIRSALVTGGSLHIGAGTISTPEELMIEELDASVTGLDPVSNKETDIELTQLDIFGQGSISIAGDGGVDIKSDPARPIQARAKLGDMRFTTFSPKFNLELRPGATIRSELEHISYHPSGDQAGMSVEFGNSVMDGELATGSVTVGADGAALRHLNLKDGTRVQSTFTNLGLRTGNYVADADDVDTTFNNSSADLILSGQLRLEGDLAAVQDIAPEAVSAGREALREREIDEGLVTVEELGSEGKVRIMVGVHADPGKGFVARSQTHLDGSFSTRLRTQLDPAALYKEHVGPSSDSSD